MTAESVLLANDGTVIHSNFDAEKNEYFKAYLRQIYSAVAALRNMDAAKRI